MTEQLFSQESNHHTKVVFIDGPNAIGKTYFTEQLEADYLQRFPDNVIHKFDASKYTFWQGRKERVHHADVYPSDELRRMFLGHVQMIRDIKKDIVVNRPHLILVNRSLMSFIAYNLRHDHLDPDSPESLELLYLSEFFNELYESSFDTYLGDVDTLYLGLTLFKDGIATTDRRLKERSQVKRIDTEHLVYLFNKYNTPSERFRNMHTHSELIESGSSKYILDKYFR